MSVLLFAQCASAESDCAKDALGRVLCAPPGSFALMTITGVACSPGQCDTDNLGYLKCSSELGGSAIKDNMSPVACVRSCINPSK